MIETLISSKTRIKLLLKFFINSNNEAYLRKLEEEFQESTNSIRIELNRLEKANMLQSAVVGNKKLYRANTKHPLFFDLKKIVLKHVGIDKIIENVIDNLGFLEKVYLTGKFAEGLDSNTINLVFIGSINENYLNDLIVKSESLIKRKIAYTLLRNDFEFEQNQSTSQYKYMLLWSNV